MEAPARIRDLLLFAQTSLMEAGIEDAALSAQVLLAHVLRVDRTGLLAHDDALVSDELRVRFWALIEARKASSPIAYLVGEREFFSMPFLVDARVLIPRPETEVLVQDALESIAAAPGAIQSIVDVGCGSGIVPIVLKDRFPALSVRGIDRSADALWVARTNARRHGVDVEWIEGDLLSAVEGPLDLITANLPYIPTPDLDSLDPGVRNFEPTLALDGGPDGLDLIRRLVPQAQKKLRAGGILLLEFGMGQSPSIQEVLRAHGFSIERVRADLASIPRVIRARKP